MNYEAFIPVPLQLVREKGVYDSNAFRWTERHLQCIWFDERLRPRQLITREGEPVIVDSPGHWNLEAGPDFIDASLRIGNDQRRIRGDVELHVRPTDWDRHHHDRAGLYHRVALHVTYYAGPLPRANTTGMLHLSLCDALASVPSFCFDDIDLSAYPHAVMPTTPRPCCAALRDSAESWEELLRSAGRHRLRLKVERMRTRLAHMPDREQVFYEETMAALGYSHNAAAFRKIAQQLPLGSWNASGSPESGCAQLLGAANLLPDIEKAEDEESRLFVRRLWDSWWKHPLEIPPEEHIAVIRHGTRPHNAPARRLAAAAALFCGGDALFNKLSGISREPGKTWFDRINHALTARLDFDFWRWHLTATGKRQAAPAALIGTSRLSAIATNVVLPMLIAEQAAPESLAEHLPSEDLSAPMRETACALFSRDHNPALYATSGLCQQGLLQIYYDFCLPARTGCEGCLLAERLASQCKK